MRVLSHDVVIHLQHVVFQGVSLKIDGDHASRFVPQLVAKSPIGRFLALPGRRADSCSEGSLGEMCAECRHQRLTAIVEGRELGPEELQYAVVSLASRHMFTRNIALDR